GNCDLFVNLRCMKIQEKNAELFIGCGINKGSIPEKEFLETLNKSQTMKKVL
ncbi:MAG: chorismate-binding protein, partial [Flavobacterium sp.]